MSYFTIMPMENKKNNLPRGLIKDNTVKSLAPKYLERAYKNLDFMNIISQLSTNKEAQKALKLPGDYSNDEWITITAYYSMYTSALALLAKIGYKSDNHKATILALEKFFVKKEIITPEDLALFKHAHSQINPQDVDELAEGKKDREIAQYNVTKSITHAIAEASMKNAYNFVNKVKSILG